MTTGYWQSKIWGILHDPLLKALHNNSGRGDNSFWQKLEAMSPWIENNLNPEESGKTILQHIHLADYISSASDRGAIGSLTAAVNYNENGIETSHLLSGKKLNIKLKQSEHNQVINNRNQYLKTKEQEIFNEIPKGLNQDYRKLFWWLWRCLPEKTCELFNEPSLLLMPAETRLPDSSIWSHSTITSALAGALAGYDLTTENLQERWSKNELSRPYIASFSFSPIQELIKASRKMKDFWAGSWILHYLSAKVCWGLAWKYGPDCFIYPNLYAQPLIDHWIRKDLGEWVDQPSDRALLTAGFPNVLVLILPEAKVASAMQQAKSLLLEEWHKIAHLVFTELHDNRHWLSQLSEEDRSWKSWLDAQWQTYWSAVPIGAKETELKSKSLTNSPEQVIEWIESQNRAYESTLFKEAEREFLDKTAQKRWEKWQRHFSINVGSWWAPIFDSTRVGLATVKNARNWKIPTVFGPRSTISGIGYVVHGRTDKQNDWVSEKETRENWQRNAGMFDGIEQLNATETVKRGLEKILPELLQLENISSYYPDLTAGVAGYLRVNGEEAKKHFEMTCQSILDRFKTQLDISNEKWGIPYIDKQQPQYHPRLLNAGWLIEDALYNRDEEKKQLRNQLQNHINHYYPQNNPSNWYVIAAGDGDGMSEWLKGDKMKCYGEYIASQLPVPEDKDIKPAFAEFQHVTKRMGPSTHNALSRALLDFSNQLVPYLTETRYSGRLIYSGGDDILAYSNLWEWDSWLWDIRQCFRGKEDREFDNTGDYWCWRDRDSRPADIANRPLFTMGEEATISFGVIIAHHSVPLAIALENLWSTEAEAKEHQSPQGRKKDAVQIRVIYGNGNILKATSKFAVFHQWQQMLIPNIESSLFEQAATLWGEHPIPCATAINYWVKAFCEGRESLKMGNYPQFPEKLTVFLETIWETTLPTELNDTVKNWFKLAAFCLRNRNIKLGV